VGVVDRRGRLGSLQRGDDAVLELGCGARKRTADAIGVDVRDLPEVEILCFWLPCYEVAFTLEREVS
jgi:hypothetical protein